MHHGPPQFCAPNRKWLISLYKSGPVDNPVNSALSISPKFGGGLQDHWLFFAPPIFRHCPHRSTLHWNWLCRHFEVVAQLRGWPAAQGKRCLATDLSGEVMSISCGFICKPSPSHHFLYRWYGHHSHMCETQLILSLFFRTRGLTPWFFLRV